MKDTYHIAKPEQFPYTKTPHFDSWLYHKNMEPYIPLTMCQEFNTEPTKSLHSLKAPITNSSKWLHGSIKLATQQLAADIHNIIHELNTHIQTKRR